MAFEAIATLLQPPMVPTRPHAYSPVPASSFNHTPTIGDIPGVVLTSVPCVDATEFKAYISQVSALYEQLQGMNASEREARRRSESETCAEVYHEPPEAHRQRQLAQSGPTLSAIPGVYFDEDFHLENPRTFDIVSERSDVVPSISWRDARNDKDTRAPRKALATNAILQEKLSWYMDITEMHLSDSISLACAAFFSALGSLRELGLEVAESIEDVEKLRKGLASLDRDVAAKGLEILQEREKHSNLKQLDNAVLQLKRVMEGVAGCESLIDEGEAEKALAQIEDLELLMAGKHGEHAADEQLAHVRPLDIRGAAALQGLAGDLKRLRIRASKVFASRVHTLLVHDLRRHFHSVSAPDILARWEAASLRARGPHTGGEASTSPAYMGMTDELRKALLNSISGLQRSGSISEAIQQYRELVLREVREVIQASLPSSGDDLESMSRSSVSEGRSRPYQSKSSILAQNLRALDAHRAESLLSTIYIGVAELLRRVKTQSGVLLNVAWAIGNSDADSINPPVPGSPATSAKLAMNATTFGIQEEIHAALDLSNLLGQAVDISHEEIIKILEARSEQVRSLSLDHFLRYFSLNLLFTNECEAISGRSGTLLKTVVNGQIRDFIEAYGDREIQTLAQNWIRECRTSDPRAWVETSNIWRSPPSQENVEESGDTTEVSQTNKIETNTIRGATLDKETYLLPRSAIHCLEGISRFLHLIGRLPSLTPDISTLLVSYLQLFNSRCRQFILGGGATRSAATLCRITAKHLALTARALSFVAIIIPPVREFVRRRIPAGAPPSVDLMPGFDKARRSLQEHQGAIYRKLVEIMEARVRALSRQVREVEWSAGGVQGGGGVHEYMVVLTRDTNKLYRSLVKHLPERAVSSVMLSVFAKYSEYLGKAFEEADPETDGGRECMLRDVEYLVSKLGKIQGSGPLGGDLAKIIEAKKTRVAPPAKVTTAPAVGGPVAEEQEQEWAGV